LPVRTRRVLDPQEGEGEQYGQRIHPGSAQFLLWENSRGWVLAAKNALRDRLFGATEEAIPQAVALRKAKRFHPAIGVNLVGVGVSLGSAGQPEIVVFVAETTSRVLAKVPTEWQGLAVRTEVSGFPRKY